MAGHTGRASESGDAHIPLLVIGAGPYGLSTAALCQDAMESNRSSSASRWASGEATCLSGCCCAPAPTGTWMLTASTLSRHSCWSAALIPLACSPVPLRTFLDYTDWFCEEKQIQPRPTFVSRLDVADGQFIASLDDGQRLIADAVVAAPGIARFAVIPGWVPASLPNTAGRTPARLYGSTIFTALGYSSWEAVRARSSGRLCWPKPAPHPSMSCTGTIRRASRRRTGDSSTSLSTTPSASQDGFADFQPRNARESRNGSGRKAG